MKLKFIFIPISLLISMILAIWYIWPTWFSPGGIKDYQKNIALKKCELEEASSKIANAEKLKAFLGSPEGIKAMNDARDYLVVNEKKEDVFNNINYIGSISSVGVTSLDVLDLPTSDKESSGDILRVQGKRNVNGKSSRSIAFQSCLDSVAQKFGEIKEVDLNKLDPFESIKSENNAVNQIKEIEAKSAVKAIKADISVIGTYRQLIVFLDNLYRLKMMNNISMITIAREAEENNSEVAAEEGAAPEDHLKMNVSVYFGYLPKAGGVSVGFDDQIFEKNTFDLSVMKKMNKIITTPEISIGETGKDNPFLP